MRIRIWERFFSAIAGLLILFCGVYLFIFGVGIFPFRVDLSFLEGPFELWHRLVMVAAALLLCALGIHSISLLFRRRKDKGFVLQHTEYGDMSISMHAMENMVRKCIDTHEELKVTHTRIHRTRDGVVVDIRISLANGVNIPLTVNALQKQIKQYITSCSGVDVTEVRVMVETGNQLPKGAGVFAPDLQGADDGVAAQETPIAESFAGLAPASVTAAQGNADVNKEPIHQRIFKREEMPQIVPAPPVGEIISDVESSVAEAPGTADAGNGEMPETDMVEAQDEFREETQDDERLNEAEQHNESDKENE